MALGKLPDDDPGGEAGIFADINITPLTDIFLVLLIIFMVGSSLKMDEARSEGLKVNLPKGSQKEIDTGAKSLVVGILPTGEIRVAGQAVKDEDLKSLFTSAVAKDPNTQVIIEADRGVPHGTVVNVMGLAKGVGITRLAIATSGSAAQ